MTIPTFNGNHYYQMSKYLLWTGLLVMFLVFTYLFWPVKIFEVVGNSQVLTPTVKPGGFIKYRTSYCKYKDVSGKISKFLMNEVFIPYTPYISNIQTGCHSVDVVTEIPRFSHLGRYYIKIIAEYPVGPFKVARYEYRTDYFDIVE